MDLLDSYYFDQSVMPTGSADFEKAKKKAISLVLPYIISQKLTDKQQQCIKYKYDLGKNQSEIAELMHLSQPTVSRHISSAKKILNDDLKYCFAAVTAALGEYDRLGQSCGY